MIFITLGSQKFQFNRLLKAIDKLIADGKITDEVFAQIGYSDYIPVHFQYKTFLDREEFAEYEEKGYTVTRPTDIDAWKEKVAPVYDKMYAAHPTWEGLVEMVRAAK